MSTLSGIEMSKNTKLSILRRARKILSNPMKWGKGNLYNEEQDTYCLLGACERAAYDLGLFTEDPGNSFDNGDFGGEGLGYVLGKDLSLYEYTAERYQTRAFTAPYQVNDRLGYDETLKFLDSYIVEVEQGRPR